MKEKLKAKWGNLDKKQKQKIITIVACALAVISIFSIWSFYTRSPWTRDGKVRADVIALAPDVSGRVTEVLVTDNCLAFFSSDFLI